MRDNRALPHFLPSAPDSGTDERARGEPDSFLEGFEFVGDGSHKSQLYATLRDVSRVRDY